MTEQGLAVERPHLITIEQAAEATAAAQRLDQVRRHIRNLQEREARPWALSTEDVRWDCWGDGRLVERFGIPRAQIIAVFERERLELEQRLVALGVDPAPPTVAIAQRLQLPERERSE